ncbi:MAG: phosphatidylglycerophosphatase A [Methylococcales bacterium]|nr:phosphatidylglycerophosphatase A [Methylococcales bacterium]
MMTQRPKLDFQTISSDPVLFVAFGFGSGLSPKAPGTIGTLVAYPLYFLLMALMPSTFILAVLAVFFVIGIYLCDQAGAYFGVPDHSGIVWDEIVAMLFILVMIPLTPVAFGVAFLLFRFFDIVKPWPIGFFDQKLKNGFGVMFDDALAAIYTLACFWGYALLV